MKHPTVQNPYSPAVSATLQSLPGDAVRGIQWRFGDADHLVQAVQAARRVARCEVAAMVLDGGRRESEWNEQKAALLTAFDRAGLHALLLDPAFGGRCKDQKNLAAALVAFEMAWVDGGAATGSLASLLGLSPVLRCGTDEQRQHYLRRLLPGKDQVRAAFALTEPLPYAGVDKGVLSGKVRIAEWQPGQEPVLQVQKRGRFITNMDFANVVTVAVESDDERLLGSCMVILEEGDPGTFDRGAVTRKLVHQLSSTRDPVFDLRVPASRIVGGYRIENGVVVPNHSHGRVLEAVFRRSRVPVGLMTSAKLLSAIEPIVRYQRSRFRGEGTAPGTPRHELGLQLKEDALQRLVDIWAGGEASASLGFRAARAFDEFDTLEAAIGRDAGGGGQGARDEARFLRELADRAIECIELGSDPAQARSARAEQLRADQMVQFAIAEAQVTVLGPATKLWNTGNGAVLMREAVGLVGGSGLTEGCPGFLGSKWVDAQLEATYEGPEAVQRRQLASTMTNPVFLALMQSWERELKRIAGVDAQSGACALGSAFDLWRWSMQHLLDSTDLDGHALYRDHRQGVTFLMADALCWLLGAQSMVLDLEHLRTQGAGRKDLAGQLPGLLQTLRDLGRVQAARAAGEVARLCTELVFGYRRHPQWRDCQACFHADHVAHLEQTMPGIEGYATGFGEVVARDGSHADKAGPCARFTGLEAFEMKRKRLDGCLVESHLARERAARALRGVTIPEAPDYGC
ncbi:MAG: acyl-CoA/acyl-ACP dehydrogenase [Planctomycetes bacterium]|nr:acyl-CoA/acyl-ACP dehydrogenase [Planctomycetota bacterium]